MSTLSFLEPFAAGALACASIWVFAIGLRELARSTGLERWLRWVAVCRRGRRCAHLETAGIAGAEPGDVLRMTYRCQGCGTEYEIEALFLDDGSWLDREPQRVR